MMTPKLLRALAFLLTAFVTACGGGAVSTASNAGGSAPAAATTAASGAPSAARQWLPAVSDTWQWQLHGTLNTTYAVSVYDVDLFETPQATLDALKARGIHVVCYFSAGGSETWRPDFAKFQTVDMGKAIVGWPGEQWLDTRSSDVRGIMASRLDLAKSKGCDAVEPDNMDAFANDSGFALTADTQLDFNRFIAAQSHARGLSVALKNDIDQLAQLAGDFDFAVNEECHQFNECSGYSAFINAGKAVFNAEYSADYKSNAAGARDALCASSKPAGIRTLVLPLQLDDSYRFSCD